MKATLYIYHLSRALTKNAPPANEIIVQRGSPNPITFRGAIKGEIKNHNLLNYDIYSSPQDTVDSALYGDIEPENLDKLNIKDGLVLHLYPRQQQTHSEHTLKLASFNPNLANYQVERILEQAAEIQAHHMIEMINKAHKNGPLDIFIAPEFFFHKRNHDRPVDSNNITSSLAPFTEKEKELIVNGIKNHCKHLDTLVLAGTIIWHDDHKNIYNQLVIAGKAVETLHLEPYFKNYWTSAEISHLGTYGKHFFMPEVSFLELKQLNLTNIKDLNCLIQICNDGGSGAEKIAKDSIDLQLIPAYAAGGPSLQGSCQVVCDGTGTLRIQYDVSSPVSNKYPPPSKEILSVTSVIIYKRLPY